MTAPEATAPPARRHRHVLDPQVVGSRIQLQDAHQGAIRFEDPDLVVANRVLVVDEHRQRRPTDQRLELTVCVGDERGDRVRVGGGGPAQPGPGIGIGHTVRS